LRRALDQIQAVFARIEDAYFRERRSDIDMIGERILRNLMGMTPPGHEGVPKGAVVFATIFRLPTSRSLAARA